MRYILIIFIGLLVIFSSCSKPTEACFTSSSSTILINSTVTFNSECSQNASYFNWNFGDGSGDSTTTASTIDHKFTSPGKFNVTLNAKRKDGMSIGKEKPITTQTITVQ